MNEMSVGKIEFQGVSFVSSPIDKNCRLPISSKWDEEFIDEITFDNVYDIKSINTFNLTGDQEYMLADLFHKYLGINKNAKISIKCKENAILIERI